MPAAYRPRPVVLCVLDGWGHRPERADNAIALARTPNYDRLLAEFPHALLDASADAVGLPAGQMGNSEVGHTCIGAGRVVAQGLPRVTAAIADGSMQKSPPLRRLIDRLQESGGRCQLMGLMSPGGVHSHQNHMVALAAALDAAGIDCVVHAFLDGRDTPPRSAVDDAAKFEAAIAGLDRVSLGTVAGRYYAMDRDRRWERVQRAYDAMVAAEAPRAGNLAQAIAEAYAAGQNDEFVEPRVLGDYAGMADGDGVLMANFRADRVRQLLGALLDPGFAGFARKRVIRFAAACGLASYSDALDSLIEPIFAPGSLEGTLGEAIAKAGLRQLRIAETEKYAHVTFFFNGGEEREFPGEDRILVPSPKVASYDLRPAMSASEVTDRLVAAIGDEVYDFILVNYANADMVGHSGDLAAAIKAVETVDGCLGRLLGAVEAAGGALVVTADHGNVEQMRDPAGGESHTAHTTNRVPIILAGASASGLGMGDGRLCDIAPTVLSLMALDVPAEMTGRSLIAPGKRGSARRLRASA